ncbi:hypothetical protein [Kitasatospora kazusensis]
MRQDYEGCGLVIGKGQRGKSRHRPQSELEEIGDFIEEEERRAEAQRLTLDNLLKAFGAITFALAVVKIMLVARGDLNTALTLISKNGALQVAIGVLILEVPILTTGLSSLAASIAARSNLNKRLKRIYWAWFAGLSLFASFIVSWSAMVAMAMIVAFLIMTSSYLDSRREEKGKAALRGKSANGGSISPASRLDKETNVLQQKAEDAKRRVDQLSSDRVVDLEKLAEARQLHHESFNSYLDRLKRLSSTLTSGKTSILPVALLALLPLTQGFFNDRPWLAAEQLKLRSGAIVSGYVIDESLNWVTVLIDKSRTVETYRDQDIESRTACIPNGQSKKREVTIWRIGEISRLDYPSCQ